MWLMTALALLGGVILAVVVVVGRATTRAAVPGEVTAARAQVLGVREITQEGRTQHWVAFRFLDGHQRELLATPSQADVIFRGQSGTVHFAGDRLTGWVPELGGGVHDTHRSD